MEQVDIVILAETWLTKDSEQRLCIPGYTYHGIYRQQRKGGGVGFLIRNDLNFKPRLDLHCNSGIMENCFVEVNTKHKNLILGSNTGLQIVIPKNFCPYFNKHFVN